MKEYDVTDQKESRKHEDRTPTWRDMMRENPRIIYAGMVVFLIIVMMVLCTILFGVILFIEAGAESTG